MTSEQAIKMAKAELECIELQTNGIAERCNNDCENCSLCYEQGNMGEQKEWLKMAIKALEQESYNSLRTFRIDSLDSLPAVFPKIRTGKWITNGTQDSMIGEEYKCSICNEVFILDHNFNYCPNCGSKMESEDKG